MFTKTFCADALSPENAMNDARYELDLFIRTTFPAVNITSLSHDVVKSGEYSWTCTILIAYLQ